MALATKELAAIGLVEPSDVEAGYVVRMPKAYPVYDDTYRDNVDVIRRWFEEHAPNVHPVGRNGMHKYNNQDHSMYTAMLTVENIHGAHHDIWSVNVEEEYHEVRTTVRPPAERRGPGRDAPVVPRRRVGRNARAGRRPSTGPTGDAGWATGSRRRGPGGGAADEADPASLDVILEEIDPVVEPVAESAAFAPAVGIAVAGGPMLTAAARGGGPGWSATGQHRWAGCPGRTGGRGRLMVNGAAALVVVAVARLVTPQAYGDIAQLLGLFFILSMPGSAVLVGRGAAGHRPPDHRAAPTGSGGGSPGSTGSAWWPSPSNWWWSSASRAGSPGSCRCPTAQGVVLILVAAGIWILLCVDRGLLQAHRGYRALAGNLLVEGGVRTVLRGGARGRRRRGGGLRPRDLRQRGRGHRPRPLAGRPGLGGPRRRRRGPTDAGGRGRAGPSDAARGGAWPGGS